MKLKMLTKVERIALILKKDKTYEIDEEQPIVGNDWKIKVPKKQNGKFDYALIREDEGELVD